MKNKIRRETLSELNRLAENSEIKTEQQTDILDQLYQTDFWENAACIATTISMPKEFDTTRLIENAIAHGKKIVVPKTYSEGRMEFFEYVPSMKTVKTNFGVFEPVSDIKVEAEDIDLMIVPGVAFTHNNYRVGFGGGFYDRYLPRFSGVTCSLVFKEQLTDEFIPESHDIPVQHILTVTKQEEIS